MKEGLALSQAPPIGERLGQVGLLDALGPREIGDGAGHPQDAVVAAGGEGEALVAEYWKTRASIRSLARKYGVSSGTAWRWVYEKRDLLKRGS